ncbi:Tetratricopeptide repeat protein 33 [Acanthosepion pharaonis]|uniref:Tetratricopeptide repeat protein 33 n=1 Tax=Acanthosepion pharaonis TaxID=158019 RepID=A0A812CU89_ACAPH|nr:Tetratricopeptide repeat protein 33 [Sepia pharaonis]
MTSFGWKRKIGEKISRTASAAFQADAEEDEDEIDDGQIDWLTLAPKRKFGGGNLLEDTVCKSDRLRQEGNTLCEAERYWEAIKKWDEAIQLTPSNEVLYELKAQVLLILQEVFPAVQFAEKATKLKPNWWSAYQTLGRALLGLGEVKLAVRAFSKAVHLNPTVQELWKEDLQWACTLLEQKKHITAELEESTLTNSATIKELDTESRTDDAEEYIEDVVSQDKDSDDENALADDKYDTYRQQKLVSLRNSDQSLTPKTETVKVHEELSPPHQTSQVKKTVKSLPTNYVLMRKIPAGCEDEFMSPPKPI